MNITPFIRSIKLNGGTFYTFSSASEDLTFTLSNSKKKFSFSKFALLNIPILGRPDNGQNYIQLNAIPGAYTQYGSSITGDLNSKLAESFQNYCLNFETMLTAREEYNADALNTVSERVFFKWLKETGAMRFREATVNELSSTSFGSRFVEEDSSATYSKIVKYLGDINIINNLKNRFNSYTEVYIHVPTSHGDTANVLFNAVDDENYYPGIRLTNDPLDPLNDEYVFGRNYDDTHPAGLDFHGHWDSDGTFNDFWSHTGSAFVEYPDSNFKWWYDLAVDSSFFTDPNGFNNAANEDFAIGDDPNVGVNLSNVKVKRSKLDGISVEFNPAIYTNIASDLNVKNFGEYNSSAYAKNFEFNAVLIYYDIYDPLNLADRATNLFGILFLDNVDPNSTGGGLIPTLPKIKPNELIQSNGNAYAFKLNLKFDATAETAGVEVSINDYNTLSLELYIDALNKLNKSSKLLEENIHLTSDLSSDLQNLKELVETTETADEFLSRLEILEQKFEDAENVFLNNENIINLLERNYLEITNIYRNVTTVDMSYNLNVITEGDGINIDRNTRNNVRINNSRQSFTIKTNPKKSIETDFEHTENTFSYIHQMLPFDNYLRITDGIANVPYDVDRDIILYVNDETESWRKGQRMRLSFENGLDLSNTNGNFNFYIYTDALDVLNKGFIYSSEIAVITYTQFEEKNNKPVIEIICLNPETFEFVIDIF